MTTAIASRPSFLSRAARPGAAPSRTVLYGVEGVGKSSFGANAPHPIFLAAEDGIRHLDGVIAFPEPKGLADVYAMLDELAAGGHDRKTLVVDTIDWLEPVIARAVCERNRWDDLETPGYGKGYVPFLEEWRKVLAAFDRVRAAGVELVLLGHAKVANFANPKGADFSRYELAMNAKSAAIIKQWADFVLFANFDDTVVVARGRATDPNPKGKGMSTGERVIHTTHDAAWDAKFRGHAPAVLPLDYASFAEARDSRGDDQVVALAEEIKALSAGLPKERLDKMNVILGDWKNVTTLKGVLNTLRAGATKEGVK